MNKEQGSAARHLKLIIPAFFAACLVLIVLAARTFYGYTSNRLYEESVSQLHELSNQLMEKLNIQLDWQWDYLNKLESYFAGRDSVTEEELTTIIRHCEDDIGPSDKHILFRAIDSDGYYYTNEGRQGLWTGLDKLTDDNNNNKDRRSFIIANWMDNSNYMAFTHRPSRSIKVDSHTITHFVLLRATTDMEPFFHSSAFGNHNLAYIIGPYGTILAESGSLSGIDFTGRNLFYNMEQQTYPHMGSFDAVLEAGSSESDTTVCTDVIINGQSFFIIYDSMPAYEWGMFLIVSADDVASTTADMVSSLIRMFIAFAVTTAVFLLMFMLFIMRYRRDKRVIALKAQNEAAMAETNRILTETNAELQRARYATEQALITAEAATKAKTRFLANMSHDIRTPMNAIIGITKLMEHEVHNPDKLSYYIGKLKISGTHMLGLINDILDMSKIESGDVHLNLEPIRLSEQIEQVENIIRSQSNARQQTFTVKLENVTHEYLIGDSMRIRQIVLNLLTNAVKYTQPGGDIQMVLTELPCSLTDHVMIRTSVIDNGYGMSAEFLKHIFEPFTRAENSTTNKVQGTGLGMSITKNIVDLMGGTITVESELDKGSRFDVILTMPVDTEAEAAAEAKAKAEAAAESEAAAKAAAASRLQSGADMVDANVSCADGGVGVGFGSGSGLGVGDSSGSDGHGSVGSSDISDGSGDNRHGSDESSGIGNGSDGDGRGSDSTFDGTSGDNNHGSGSTSGSNIAPKQSVLNGKRFLCAEDNELNAEILEALLDIQGASCTICRDGAEIVEAFASVKPGDYDAILMDVQMPNMNGMDATRAIRSCQNPLGHTIPIIAMTANAFSSDVQDCLAAGMNAHLAKPLDISELEHIIAGLI